MHEALGRSRGGYGTKACVITDGAGRAISFALAPGQAHELPLAQDLVDCLPDIPGWVVGDKGYASHAFRQFIWDQGARPAIPAKSNEAPVACPGWIYNNRNRVERLWARLKEWRAVATRCQSASNNQPASASNIQPFFWLQNPLSRESTGGSRARRGVPVMADVAARVGGTCGPPWARHGRKEGQERFLNRQLSFPVSRISQ